MDIYLVSHGLNSSYGEMLGSTPSICQQVLVLMSQLPRRMTVTNDEKLVDLIAKYKAASLDEAEAIEEEINMMLIDSGASVETIVETIEAMG